MRSDIKQCFLIAPIGSEGSEVRRRSDTLLKYVIAPATAETGYNVVRADDISIPGSITAQIIQLTIESPLVIADLSGRNPNVLYELGIRHAARKPVIQLASDSNDLPFDIASVRTIIVDLQNIDSVARAKDQLHNSHSVLGTRADCGRQPGECRSRPQGASNLEGRNRASRDDRYHSRPITKHDFEPRRRS